MKTGRWPIRTPGGDAGAAGAGSRLRKLDAVTTSRAMRIAATLVLTPSYNSAVAARRR